MEQAIRMRELEISGIRKMFELAGKDAINFGIGEPDFQPPDFVIDAFSRAMREGKNNYGPSSGIPELRAAIAEKERHRLPSIDASHVIVTAGSTSGLYATLASFINPGDEVLIPNPGFVLYRPHTFLCGGIPVAYPLRQEYHYRPRVDDLEQLVTPRTKALIVNSPSNPTGACLREKDVDYIVEFARRHNLLLITDEAYDTITFDRPHATFLGKYENTVYLNTFSKAYAMTGWRVGWICAPAAVAALCVRVHQYTMLCAPHVSQLAAVEALEGADADVEAMVADYDRRRRVFVKGLREIGLECPEPGGAFYAFPSIRTSGLDSETFAERLLHEESVAVVPGNVFGPSGEGHIRCSYATALPQLEEALVRIDRFLGSLR